MGAPASPPAGLSGVLRAGDFRSLLAVRLTAQACDGAFQLGLASLFFFSPERAATAGAIAAAFSVAIVPYTLVGPFAGVLLDRWRRRNVLLIANALRAAIVVAVAALVLAGRVGPPLYLLVLVCVGLSRFFLAGLGAALPHVVPRGALVAANAFCPTAGTLSTLLGAGVGYAVRMAVGPGDRSDALVLLLAAGGYLGSARLARRMPRDLLGPDEAARAAARGPGGGGARAAGVVVRGLREGVRHLRDRPAPRRAIAVTAAYRFALGITAVATILVCRNRLEPAGEPQAGLRLLAVALAATGVGYGAAALFTAAGTRRTGRPAWVVLCLLLAAVTQSLLVAALNVELVVVCAALFGMAAQGVKICVDATLQDGVDDAFRGRVFSLYDMVFNGAFVAAAVAAAVLLPRSGYTRVGYGAIVAGYVVTAVVFARAQGRRREPTGRFTRAAARPTRPATRRGLRRGRPGRARAGAP